MKIVSIMGGLGNQMFQYAFAKVLEHKSGDAVLLDLSWFGEQSPGDTPRKYELDLFRTQPKFATKKQMKPLTGRNRVIRWFWRLTGKGGHLVREYKNPKYDTALLDMKGNVYYKGYFQCPKYFENVADEIRRDFTFPQIAADDAFNQKWLKRFAECENPVFVHLRRGDYAKIAGWMLPLEYYQKAVAQMCERVKNPTFFVFGSECDDYIKNEFNLGVPFEIIGEENARNKENWKDIVLMMHCKHAIIANSTFSWWAAWLSDVDGRTIIAPTPFTNGDEIVPDNWIKIKR